MTALILGANKSGKSLYAEALAARLFAPQARFYLATLLPCGAEDTARVRRHRLQRRGLGFHTVECPRGFSALRLPENAGVLLEDVSNLLANLLFAPASGSAPPAPQRARALALAELEALSERSAQLIMVSISGLCEAEDYDAPTNAYIRALNSLNAALYERADCVVELAGGVPTLRKGEPDALA